MEEVVPRVAHQPDSRVRKPPTPTRSPREHCGMVAKAQWWRRAVRRGVEIS